MSGAGYGYPAGYGPAGEDPPAALSSGPSADGVPAALDFNEGTFALGTDGRYGSIHPIDQRMRLALLLSRYRSEGGRIVPNIPAAPDQGFDWTTPFQWGEKLTADVTDRLRNAIRRAGLMIGQDIQEVRISVSSQRTAGRISFEYVYRNLRTSAEVVIVNG